MPRYLVILLATLGALSATLVAINAIGYRFGFVEAANRDIYTYQRAKVHDGRSVDIAFVGDSSLGNAIDAALFASLSGRTVDNLALNGSYGSGGAFNMTLKLLDAKSPKLVVVTQSIDTMRRRDAFAGYYFSAEPSQLLTMSPVHILELYFSWKTARRVVQEIAKHGWQRASPPIAGDYIAQSRPPLATKAQRELDDNPLEPDMVSQPQIEFLARIAALCRARGIACVYAHGPIYDGYCAQARAYVARLDEQITSAGLRVLPGTPVCLSEAEVGDSIDHVRPDLKQVYTRRYFDLLRDVIAADGGVVAAQDAPRERGGAP